MRSAWDFFQARFRPGRMKRFEREFASLDRCRVLDVGGTPSVWRYVEAPGFEITLLNLNPAHVGSFDGSRYRFICGDALDLPFLDRSFDVVFSNSVIEHVGEAEEQERFAGEVRRVGGHVWVQTPSCWFPVEPHVIGLGVHYLPPRWRARLLPYFSVWGWVTKPDRAAVEERLAGIRLLTKKDMKRLFPDCKILTERFCFLPKAYIAVR